VNISVARSAAGAHQEAVAADRLIAIAVASLDTATESLELSEALVKAGRESANVLPALRARIGRLTVALEDLRARRIRALHDLAGVLSLPPGSVKAVTGELLIPADLPEDAPTENPEVALREAEAETHRARTRSAGSEAYPDVTVGFGYEGDDPKNADDLHSIGFFVEVPLPFFDRNQGEVRESVAAVRRSEELTESERTRVASEYALTLDLIRSGTANRNTWRERIVPALVRDSELRKKEFEAGRTDRKALLEARLAELEATAAAVEVEARLAALVLDALALLGRSPEGWTPAPEE
jgi:cobalt-zinc-cadmium efflux system outer membrane protein